MEKHEIQSILMNALSLQEIYISGDGRNFQIIAVSKIFTHMNRIKKQQTIYKPLEQYITNNRIHSLSIHTYTPQEWKTKSQFYNL